MGRNVPRARRKRSDALPLCIFPRGRRIGIRCVTLRTVSVGGRTVKLCDEPICAYNEKTDKHDLGLGYVGVEV